MYDITDIETAFFNYDSDGSEPDPNESEQRRKDWRKFKERLEKETQNPVSSERIA